jgi:CubicO group peptidase (beta-lactamase class C family)
MRNRRSRLLLKVGVLPVLCLPLIAAEDAPALSQSRMGPLAVDSQNPRYFQNTATGAAVYLTGSHTWANLVDIGPSDPPPAFNFDEYVAWMAGLNHNFMRMWTWELVSWDTKANGEGKRHTAAPQPYARTGPGTALDGKPKFDLTQFNPAYFDRLAKRIALARARGIYVSVMLFEGWGLQFSPGAWQGHPFHPRNNINGIDGDTNKDGKGVEIHELGNPAVTAIQEAYVRKVIDTVNGFDNVLYEISNENHPPSTEWQYHMIRFIKAYERTKPQQHPVGMTFQYKGGSNQTLFDSPADWISPNPDGGYRDDPPVSDGRKVVLSDTDHLWGLGGNQAWVWKSFTRAYNPLFMDPYDGDVLGNRFDPKWDPIRRSLGYTLRHARRMNLAAMRPAVDLASTGYCLAAPGRQYLVFQPGPGDTVTVKLAPGTYSYEWFDPAPGEQVEVGTKAAADGETRFACPIRADGVLLVTRTVFPARDWEEATPESQGLDSIRLQAAIDYLRDNAGPDGVNEAVVVRNGYLVWKGSNIDKVHGIWSATKSFTSTVLGLLIDDGKATLATPAKDFVPALAPAYPGVTLRHFTAMTSGYRARQDEPRGSYRHGPSPTPFDPCDTPLFAPGTQYAYWDSAMNEFGLVLTRIADESLEDFFRRRIADPIGMDRSQWHWGVLGRTEGLAVNGGSGNSNKHIFISARQLARLGLLFLNGGNWNGRQLISAEWVEMATQPQVSASLPLWPDSGADGRGVYGFNWWLNGIKANGRRKWPGAPVGTYAASGYNNNDMFIIPEWNMVIVRLGLDQQQRAITDIVYSSFLEKVGQAIMEGRGSNPQP